MQDMQDLVFTNAESRFAKLELAMASPVDTFDEAKYSIFHLIDKTNTNDKCIPTHDFQTENSSYPPN